MEGTCTTQPTWAPDKAVKCFDPSAALGGGVAGRSSIGGIEDWLDSGANKDPVESAGFLARLNAIDHDTCDGWTVDGAPEVHVTRPSSGRDSTTIIIIIVVVAVVLLGAVAVLAFVMVKIWKKKPPAQPAVTGTPVTVSAGAARPADVQLQITAPPATPRGQGAVVARLKELALEQYASALFDEGYDSMASLQGLTKDEAGQRSPTASR
jgi:hypothetical protein